MPDSFSLSYDPTPCLHDQAVCEASGRASRCALLAELGKPWKPVQVARVLEPGGA